MEAYSLILKYCCNNHATPATDFFLHTQAHMHAHRHEPALVRHHFKRNIKIGGFTEDFRNQKSMVLCSSGKRLAVKYADQLPIRLLGT